MADLHQKRIFRVLGPLDVLIVGDGVPITSTRQGIILATLLMAPNRVSTLDMLIEAIWDDRPPVTARRQVQICVSALRRTIGTPNIVETCSNGYRILLRPNELDYSTFAAAISKSRVDAARGDIKQAVAQLETALDLWRGPALAGLPGRAAETMAHHLEELRISAIESRIEMRLALGEHYELSGELVVLTARYPLRERLWGFRMLAMYRSGRQAEALNAYRAARQVLVEELGLEPGKELRDLERAILSHDPGLILPGENSAVCLHGDFSPPPAQPRHRAPTASSSVNGRGRELLRLLSVLDLTEVSAPSAAAVLGCALAEALALLAELAGAGLLTVIGGTPAHLPRYRLPELPELPEPPGLPEPAAAGQRADRDGAELSALSRVCGALIATADAAYRRIHGASCVFLRDGAEWPAAGELLDGMLTEPIAWLSSERTSVRAAVIQAASRGLDELCWQLAVSFVPLYESHGLHDDWRDTHTVALTAVRESGDVRGQAAVLASLGSLGVAQYSASADGMLLESLSLFEQLDDASGRAFALRAMADIDRIQARPKRAVRRYEQALHDFRRMGDVGSQVHVLAGLAGACGDLGQLEQAETHVKDALLVAAITGSDRAAAQALYRLGDVLLQDNQVLAARAAFLESLRLAQELSDRAGEAYALNGLAGAAVELRELDLAEKHLAQAADLCRSAHQGNLYAHTLLGLANVSAQRGERSRAARYCIQASVAFENQGNNVWHSRALDRIRALR